MCLVVPWVSLGVRADTWSSTEEVTEAAFGDGQDAAATTMSGYDLFVDSVKSQESEGRKMVAEGLKKILPMMVRMGHESGISSDCQMAYFKTLMGLKDLKIWALKLLDSSGKVPDGILEGSLSAWGAYNECVDVVARDVGAADDVREYFRGQYCALDVRPYLPPKPKKYNPQDMFRNLTEVLPILRKALQLRSVFQVLSAFENYLSYRANFVPVSSCLSASFFFLSTSVGKQMKSNVTVPWCEIKEKPVLPGYYLGVLSIFGVGILINIVGTLLQVGPKILRVIRRVPQPIKEPQKNVPRQLLEAFSVYANSQKVLSTKTNDRSMRCLHGIRFVSMLWVMLGHVYFSRNNSQVLGAIRAKGLGKDFAFQVVLNASLSVDTFFLLSGLLLMFVCYGKLKKDSGRFDFLVYYVHRYIRLTPPFLMVSLLLILGPPWMNGPIWHETVDRFAEGCKRYWWTNLIYISSWMKNDEVCLPHGWYLSCDMQYFIIAPLFFVALYRKPALGFGLIGAAAFVSMALTGLVTYIFDFGPVALFSIPDDDNLNSFLNNIAFRPYTHFPSFAVGLLLGYIIYKYREIKISRKMQLAGWLSAVTTGLTILYGVYDWNAYSPPGPFLSILYGSTSRPAWSLCVAWVTFACVSGHGGFVNTLLSWKAFVPLSKLTFMAYLLHPPLMFMYAAHTINAVYVTQFMMV
ncbi:unnamed protein product, partial [Ixodes pacificus]